MHIVLKWISPCRCSNTRFLLDSAFAGIYGNDCHSPSHTRTQTWCVWAYVHACLSAAALQAASRGSALRLITSLHLPISPFLILSFSLSLSFHLLFHLSLHLFLPPPPSHIVSLTLLSSLSPLCLALSTTDYLAFIQNVIKENDQLPQLPPSFLPSALSSFFFYVSLSFV